MKKWLCLVLFLTTLTYSITALLPSRIRVSAAEDDLQLGKLEEVVKDDFGNFAPAQFDHHADAVFV